MKVVWKFAGMRPGALCVMISGLLLMQQWLADSWDSIQLVNISAVAQHSVHIYDWMRKTKTIVLFGQLVSTVWWQVQVASIYVFDHNSLFCSLGAQALSRAPFGQGTGPILLDNLVCNSRETRLVDCTHNGIGSHNCLHSEDAGLRCPEPPCMYCLNCQYAYTTERDASFHCI